MFDVVTIGKATRDAFFEGDFPLVKWPGTESGKAYILPFGEKLEVKKVLFTTGGNAANASVTFARQGFRTACVAKVGNDVSGEEIKRKLRNEGIADKFVKTGKGLPTSYSVLLLEKGERTILNYLGISDSLSAADFNMKKLTAKWWYVSLPGGSAKLLGGIARFAEKNGIALAFNPSGHHIKHAGKDIVSNLGRISFLIMNTEEASMLTGIPFAKTGKILAKLSSMTDGIVALTDGRKGVTVSASGHVYHAGIFREKKLADRTGAGDAFGSGFVAGLMRRGIGGDNAASAKPEDIRYAIRLASANATANVEKTGATEGILSRKEFESGTRWRNLRISMQNK